MITGCLIFLAIICVVALAIAGALIVADLGAIILFVVALVRYFKAKRLQPSARKCPVCGSEDVFMDDRPAGTSSSGGAAATGIPGVAVAGGNTKQHYEHAAKCQKCGYTWVFQTADEVAAQQRSAKGGLVLFSAILAFMLVITAAIVGSGTSSQSGSSTQGDSSSSSTESSASDDSHGVWASGYTDLEDFDYYVDGDSIYLQKYDGHDDKVWIAPSYTVDGRNCNVVSLEDATFLFANVTSVIVPEGVTHLDDNTFNTSGVKFVYLPSTLTEINDNFLSYFYDGDKLYYGGTQDQWDSLVTAERSDIDFKQIECGASVEELTGEESYRRA